ncbi:MAG: hypothetical protein R6W70_05425 [bacterium]
MTLKSLSDISIFELIKKSAENNLSGEIKFTDKSGIIERRLFFKNGLITGSSCNDPGEYLGQYLINEGIINLEQFNRAYKTELETDVKMGAILKLIGLASVEKVMEAIFSKINDTVFLISSWEDGFFDIKNNSDNSSQNEVEIEVSHTRVINNVREIQKKVPEYIKMYQTIRSYPEISILDTDIARLSRLNRQIITLLSIGKNVIELIETLPVHFYSTTRHLFELYSKGVILNGEGLALEEAAFYKALREPSGREKPEKIQSITNEDTVNLYHSAEEEMRNKNYWKAASYFRLLKNMNPHNIVFRDALNNSEYNYKVDFYKNMFSPASRIIKSEGSGKITDPFEHKLFSLLTDKAVSIREVVAYFNEESPEIKTLRAIERLRDMGYIKEIR